MLKSKYYIFFIFEFIFLRMQSRKELYELLHYTPGKEWYYPSPHSHEIEFPTKKKSLN